MCCTVTQGECLVSWCSPPSSAPGPHSRGEAAVIPGIVSSMALLGGGSPALVESQFLRARLLPSSSHLDSQTAGCLSFPSSRFMALLNLQSSHLLHFPKRVPLRVEVFTSPVHPNHSSPSGHCQQVRLMIASLDVTSLQSDCVCSLSFLCATSSAKPWLIAARQYVSSSSSLVLRPTCQNGAPLRLR